MTPSATVSYPILAPRDRVQGRITDEALAAETAASADEVISRERATHLFGSCDPEQVVLARRKVAGLKSGHAVWLRAKGRVEIDRELATAREQLNELAEHLREREARLRPMAARPAELWGRS